MGHKKKALQLLYAILEKNFQDERIYANASDRCKRLYYKNFFRKISLIKYNFCKRIRYEIEVLENEIITMGGDVVTKPYSTNSYQPILPKFRPEKDGVIKDCYRREKQNIGMYNHLLTRINIGEIREMLLYQKHSLRQILQEIESLGLKIYGDPDDKINEGDVHREEKQTKQTGENSEGKANLGEKTKQLN